MMKQLLVCLLLSTSVRAAENLDAWQMLKSLAGEWTASNSEGEKMQIAYQLISNGSAVMETMKAPDGSAFMVTVFHRDGDSLMATHYCAAGNQPRMKAKSAPNGNKVEFRFLDVTNLSSPSAHHIRDLTFTFTDADHVIADWASNNAGKDAKVSFKMTRSPKK